MKTKYNEFILEKLKFKLISILEGTISGSSSFMDKLQMISNEDGNSAKIAKKILNYINSEHWFDDKLVKQNFFDTTEKEGMVSFLMNDKLPDDWDEDGEPELPFSYKGRGEVSIGKTIRYLMNLMEIPGNDRDLEEFVNRYKSISESTEWKFKLLQGDDIAKYYNEKKYYLPNVGTLGGSCMSDEKKGMFNLYSKNENVRLIVLIDENTDKICGRALLWKLKKSPCKAKYFMDRVYSNRDSDVFKFKRYAEENGFLYKKVMNSHLDDNVDFIYNGVQVSGEITVSLNDSDFSRYPFVDTLCFLKNKKLSNLPSKNNGWLHETDGGSDQCYECSGSCFSDYNEICVVCCEGHIKLLSKGIETKINKKIS
jgi:hypothetical protein